MQRPASVCSLIEQSQRGRHEKTTESATGIIPGNRGKAGGNWFPSVARATVGIYHQFLWTASQPIQFCDKGTERSGANLETASEPSQVQDQFRILKQCSYPEGFGCYCTTRTQRSVPVGPPHQKALLTKQDAKGTVRSGERASLAKLAKPPTWGGV